jgi:radical SAM protein with 4Fe4S-binding SPASM domain
MRGYLRFDLADNCNIRCVMCQAYNGLPVTAMNFTDFDKFVENTRGQLGDWRTIQLGNVAESTVHPKFPQFLRYIREESNANIHIVTNGKLLSRHAAVINEVGNCMVQVSMDSVDRNTHEYIREGSDYDRVMAALELLDLERVQVLLSFTLMASNIDQYEDMVEFCKSRGYRMSAFPMILREENGIIPLNLLRESLWFKQAKLDAWLRKHYGNSYGKVVSGAAPGTSNDITEFSCNAHNDDLSVDVNGTSMLCGMQNLGSLMQSGLEQMWWSAEADEFRRKVDGDRGPCMSCDYRQRCLAPSMSLIENHFSASIVSTLAQETYAAIGYGRNLTDEDAMDRLIQDLSEDFGFFDIQKSESGYTARRMTSLQTSTDLLHAASRYELHNEMKKTITSAHDCVLVETERMGYNIVRYLRRFWGLPISLGRMNLTIPAERERPGVISADTIEDIYAMIAQAGSGEMASPDTEWAIPLLLESGYRTYNIVGYAGRVWACHQGLGHVNLTIPADREKPGVFCGDNIEALREMIDRAVLAQSAALAVA